MSCKAAISFFVSMLLFAGFTVLAYTDLFDLIETRFYNPSVARSSSRKAAEDAKAIGVFLAELQARFAASLEEEAVRDSFILNQQAEDIFERSRMYGTMLESRIGLQAVRFVDSGGSRIHFSSSPQDILQQDEDSISYRPYNEDGGELPFKDVEVPAQSRAKIVFDEAGKRIIFSFPFYDSLDVHRGSALFYLSVRAVSDRLIREGLAKAGDDVSLVPKPGGFVLGLPPGQEQVLVPLIASVWNEDILNPVHLFSEETPASLTLVSAKTGDIFTGLLLEESLFVISPAMKIILLASFFSTLYLTLFLFFNIRQDPVTVVESRLNKLRIALLEHYYDAPEEAEGNWARELELRREEIRSELKRGLKDKGRDLDNLIDRAWDELLSIISMRRNSLWGDEKRLEEILNRIFKTLSASGPAPVPAASPGAGKRGSVPEPSFASVEIENFEEPEEEEPIELEELDIPGELVEAAGDGDMESAVVVEPLDETPLPAEKIAGEVSPAKTGELEELEKLENLEELDELGEDPGELEELEEELSAESPAGSLPMTGAKIDEIASEIEFADSPEEEEPGEDLMMNLDIASPFDLMSFEPGGGVNDGERAAGPDQGEGGSGTSPFANGEEGEKDSWKSPDDEEGEEIEGLALAGETGLEELKGGGAWYSIYRPFSFAGFQNLTLLKVLPDTLPVPAAQALVSQDPSAVELIEERGGLHYVSDRAFAADMKAEQILNREFKDLVDSVLGEKSGLEPL
jgi:hypothetical protein